MPRKNWCEDTGSAPCRVVSYVNDEWHSESFNGPRLADGQCNDTYIRGGRGTARGALSIDAGEGNGCGEGYGCPSGGTMIR